MTEQATTESQAIADVLRDVTKAIETRRQSERVTQADLVEILLTIADRLDPQ